MKKDMRFLAVLRSQEKANELKSAMANFDGLDWEIKVSDFENVAGELVNSHVPNVLLAEISFDKPSDMTELSRIVRSRARTRPSWRRPNRRTSRVFAA